MLVLILRAAAKQYPEVDFTMLSQQRFADLFADMPANVTFHGVDLKKQSLHEIVSGLGSFDCVADMHSVLRSFYIRTAMRLKGAKVASIDKGRRDKRRLTQGKVHAQLRHTTERYADVFAALHLPITDQLKIDKAPTSDRSGVGIAPFAAHQGKIYPIDRMERVVAMLSERGEKVVLFGGGKKEQDILEGWATGCDAIYGLSQHAPRVNG